MPVLKRALVVEDEPAMQTLIVQQLTNLGLQVDQAGCWIDGKRFLMQNKYDVVVCDNRMPKVQGGLIENSMGVELLEWIRRRSNLNEEVPFILHTSDEYDEKLQRRLTEGNGQFSPKGGKPKHYELVAKLIEDKN